MCNSLVANFDQKKKKERDTFSLHLWSWPLPNSSKHLEILEIPYDHRSILLGSGWQVMWECFIQYQPDWDQSHSRLLQFQPLESVENWPCISKLNANWRLTNHSQNGFRIKLVPLLHVERWNFFYSFVFSCASTLGIIPSGFLLPGRQVAVRKRQTCDSAATDPDCRHNQLLRCRSPRNKLPV